MKPSRTTTVSTRSVRPVLERLRALGIDIGSVLTAVGTQPGALDDPDGRIPHDLALSLWGEAVRRSGDDGFGMHAAEQIRPGAFDVLDYAVRSSATLGEGLQRLIRYHRILHDAAAVRLRLEADRAHLTHELPGDYPALPRHVAEFIVGAWIVVARQATGVDVAPLEVSFRHAAPADISEHRRLFRATVRFHAAVNGLVLPSALLDRPLVKADAGLCAVLERHVRELVEKIPRVESLGDRVRQLVAQDLSTGVRGAEQVAERLHMSSRSLQRLLRADGTSYTELVDALRHELAARYLGEARLAIAEVAFLLGFSEASAFHRAFRRWTGTTPAAYRRLLQEPGDH
jgi:AraC-like DNA-binding protein